MLSALMATGWLVTAAPPKPAVVFVAPDPLRAPVRQALERLNKTAVDASAIDAALFGDGAHPSPLQHGKLDAQPAPGLPAEVAADWTLGLAHCRAWPHPSEVAQQACARAVAEASWQRYLQRGKPARVIELKLDGHHLQAISYAVHDRLIPIVSGPIDAALTLPPRLVPGLLDAAKLPLNGNRSNSDRLPGATPPTAVNLDAVPAQTLPAITLPRACSGLPPAIQVAGPKALAHMAEAVWRRSSAGKTDAAARPLACALGVSPDAASRRAGEPFSNVALTCSGSRAAEMQLFPSDDLADPALQATLLNTLVGDVLAEHCNARRPR